MGLLDLNDPEQQGLLSLVGSLMGTGNFGDQLSKGVAGYQAAQSADSDRKAKALTMQRAQLELEQMRKAQADQELANQTAAKFYSPGQPAYQPMSLGADMNTGIPATAGKAPSFDMQGYANARMAQNPMAGMAILQALQKELPIDKLSAEKFTPQSLAKFQQSRNYGDLIPRDKLESVDGVMVNPYDPRNANRAIPNPNKPFYTGTNGEFMPNVPYQKYEFGKAEAGKPSTLVKVENQMGGSIAQQVGPMLKEGRDAANGAAMQADAAKRILAVTENSKIFAGPGADTRLKIAQVGDLLGIGGKSDAEKIANTRQAIRGLAEMTLQGRKQMHGQGQITDKESALAEKANSGDISDLTPSEIKQLANASARAAKFVHNQYADYLGSVKRNPDTAGLAAFYQPFKFPDMKIEEPIGSAPAFKIIGVE